MPHVDNLYIFTDSQFTLCVLTKGHQVRAAATTSLLNALKLLISTIPLHVKLNVVWIPAHLDISDNEHADLLAGLGSKASTEGRRNVDRASGIASLNFLPCHDPPEPE